MKAICSIEEKECMKTKCKILEKEKDWVLCHALIWEEIIPTLPEAKKKIFEYIEKCGGYATRAGLIHYTRWKKEVLDKFCDKLIKTGDIKQIIKKGDMGRPRTFYLPVEK